MDECICLASFRVLRGREHVQTTTSYELEFQNVLELLVPSATMVRSKVG
jgi:hypothetical protein